MGQKKAKITIRIPAYLFCSKSIITPQPPLYACLSSQLANRVFEHFTKIITSNHDLGEKFSKIIIDKSKNALYKGQCAMLQVNSIMLAKRRLNLHCF